MVFPKHISQVDGESYESAAFDVILRDRRIQHVYGNTPSALAINSVSAILASLVIYSPLTENIVLTWVCGMFFILLCRYLLYLCYSAKNCRLCKASSLWGPALLAVLMMNGLWWAIFGVLTFLYSEPPLFGFSGFVLGGMIAGAVATLGAFLPAYICFTFPAVCSMVLILFWLDSTVGTVMALLTIAFAITMLVTVMRVHRILSNNLLLTLKNENLVRSLMEANSRLSATNANLEFVIEERVRAEKQIEFLASHDTLTGLANRRLQEERYVKAMARANRNGQKLALLFIDLDFFKNVNDSLGHPAGDRVLQMVADRLRNCLRTGESVCRQGGDEFLLVAEICETSDAGAIAQRIISSIRLPFAIEGKDVQIGASIGISLYPDDGLDFQQLLVRADQALYLAKREEKGHFCFYDRQKLADTLCDTGV